jgi:hypothetical protein
LNDVLFSATREAMIEVGEPQHITGRETEAEDLERQGEPLI